MQLIYKSIDALNLAIGNIVKWLTLVMVLLQFWLVLTRYLFSVNSLYQQELVVYMHGVLIMLGIAYTLLKGGHVRIDMYYRTAPRRNQDFVNLFGYFIFLLPVCFLMIWAAYPDVSLAWKLGEGSTETSGIPAKHLLKTTVIAMAVLLSLQAVSEIIKCLLSLAGHSVDKQDSTVDIA